MIYFWNIFSCNILFIFLICFISSYKRFREISSLINIKEYNIILREVLKIVVLIKWILNTT